MRKHAAVLPSATAADRDDLCCVAGYEWADGYKLGGRMKDIEFNKRPRLTCMCL